MSDPTPPDAVLPYAAAPARQRSSPYAFASLAVSAAVIVWFALAIGGAPLPFDVYKQHRIGGVLAVLALILALGAYRQPNRRRTAAHAAIAAAGLALAAYLDFAPL
jgi:hypothetical protein